MPKTFLQSKLFAILGVAIVAAALMTVYDTMADRYFGANGDGDSRKVLLINADAHVTVKDASVQFIGDCAGMDMTVPGVYLVGVSECMGRVRGLVDGHNMTVATGKMMSAKNAELQLWCIGADVTAEEMLDEVMDWVDADPKRYQDILKTTDGNNGSMIATVKALRAAYPCINS